MAAPAPGADSKESAADKKSPPKSPPSNFYGYLFDANKAPTKTLENLLRAIGKHIIAEIGDKNTNTLTPPKLAAFYKAVGGNYDSLFVNVPYQSISFIWQFTGCQYSLQPADGKDYEPPSIPALTLRGFVRWQSIEILLGPEEHVPFIQHAVKHWALKNPDTGEPFPTDLPKEAFPGATDPDIDKWHKSCAAKLKQQAEPHFDQANLRRSFGDHPRPHSSERAEPKARMPYAHLRNPNSETTPNARPGPDYFARPVRVVPGRVPSQRVQVPLSPERTRFHPGSSSDERARRRSLSDHPSPQADGSHGFKHLHPERPAGPARRHSQPRHASSSDSISDSDDASPPMRHRPGSGPEDNGRRRPGSVRHIPAGGHSAPSGSSQPHPDIRPHRADDPRKRSLPFTVPDVIRDKFDKVTSFVSNGRSPDRHRSASGRRNDRERDREREIARRNREHMVASKLRGSWEDLDGDASDGSDSSVQRHTRMKLRRAEKDAQMREDELRFRKGERDRERERERERGRDRGRARQDRERDWERERERDEELETRKRRDRERFLQRPEVHRRTSSHADIDRMREEAWEPRDRDFRDDKRRWKEREPAASPVTGVSGRRYPAEPVWN